MATRVLCGDPRHGGNIVVIGQGLSSKGFAPEDAPPTFNQVEPYGSHRNEGMLDAGMGFEPFPDGILVWLARLSAIR
jgi:hypothetical protein